MTVDRLRAFLSPGRIVRVTGPARIRVAWGQVLVLGAVYNPGEEFEVHQYRSYGIKALDEAAIDVELGPGAAFETPRPGEEPLEKWVSVVDSMLRRGCRTFMVLGPTDAGKSSIAALIANRALLRGLRVGIVDSDVGQADVGPPAFVSAALVDKRILWLRQLSPWKMRFVGYITPQRGERRIVGSIVELASLLRYRAGVDVVIIDTDGWVQGVNSVEYKIEAARLAGVDSVIVVGDSKLAKMVEAPFRSLVCGVASLESPGYRRVRDRDERRELRGEQYRRFLGSARARRVSLAGIAVQGSCFFTGEPLPRETVEGIREVLRVPVEAASETYDTVYVVTTGQPLPDNIEKLASALGKQVYVLDKRNMKGALLAVIGARGEEEAPGVLLDVDFARLEAEIATPYTGEVRGIIVGGVRLGEDYSEVGRPLRCIM